MENLNHKKINTKSDILFLNDIHPADMLEIIRYNDEKLEFIIKNLSKEVIVKILDEADSFEKIKILNIFNEKDQKELLQYMSSDELTDLVGELDEINAKKILDNINSDYANDVRNLLLYDSETAGGIMATEYIAIDENITIGETLKHLQIVAPDAETAYYIYLIDKTNKLKGVVSLREIVIQSFDTYIMDIATKNVIVAKSNITQKEVGNIFQKYGFFSLPVVNESNEIIGIITVDDIMDILKKENTKDIHGLAGIDKSERVDGKIKESIRSRLPWLGINLITAIIASFTVSLFEDTINQLVILATFMPIVAGMGGNAGTQTLTIMVRGMALGELNKEKRKKIFIKELGVGLTTGLIIGLVIAILGIIWSGKLFFGLVIGVAMMLNMTFATVAGFIIPTILKKIHIDPALASSVFVTTVTDILGFLLFLGLAQAFINFLV